MGDAVVDPTCVETGALGGGARGRHGDGARGLVRWGRGARLAAGLRRHRHTVRVVPLQRVIVARLLGRAGLALATAAVEAAAQAAAEVTARQDTAADEQRLAPGGRDHEIRVDILLAELFRYVQPQRAVIVVNIPLRGVAQDRVSSVDVFKLFCGLWIVWVLVRVVFQSEFPIRLLDIVLIRRLRQRQNHVKAVASRR